MTRALVLAGWLLLAAAPASAQDIEPRRDPSETAMKSVILPGWGQWENGQRTKAQAYGGSALVTVALMLDLIPIGEGNDRKLVRGIGLAGYLLTASSAGFDAYHTAVRLNRENGYEIGAKPDVGIQVVVWSRRF